MKRPKGTTRKTWQIHLEATEMNRRIIKEKMKDSMYVPDWLDERMMDRGEYKADKKKARKK